MPPTPGKAVAPSSQELASLYQSWGLAPAGGLPQQLELFIEANENPNRSHNFKSSEPDPLECFIRILNDPKIDGNAGLVLSTLKALKILSRKQENRLKFGIAGIRAILFHLNPAKTNAIAAEGSNVLLNACYERANVMHLLQTSGVECIVGFLRIQVPEVQANAAGAMQSICFQDAGRKHVREQRGIPKLLELLNSEHSKVVTRAIGAIHNLSSDGESIRIIRTQQGIPKIVHLLSAPQIQISGSAAGALQNLSREIASRLIIRELEAIQPLAMLLSASDVQAQVCAAGALLNILGPELEVNSGIQTRRGFGKIMSLVMAISIVYDGLFPAQPEIV